MCIHTTNHSFRCVLRQEKYLQLQNGPSFSREEKWLRVWAKLLVQTHLVKSVISIMIMHICLANTMMSLPLSSHLDTSASSLLFSSWKLATCSAIFAFCSWGNWAMIAWRRNYGKRKGLAHQTSTYCYWGHFSVSRAFCFTSSPMVSMDAQEFSWQAWAWTTVVLQYYTGVFLVWLLSCILEIVTHA